MTAAPTVLVTGMSGLIGGFVGAHLAKRYALRALNRRPVEGVDTVCADVADFAALRPAFEGVEVVVHLAALIEGSDAQILATNVNGTYNVLEAARQAGVRRVVFASSGSVCGGYESDERAVGLVAGAYAQVPRSWRRLRHDDPTRPNGIYAASKVAGEALGRTYAEAHGLSVLCLRLGRVEAADRPLSPRHMAVFLTQGDCRRLFDCAVEAPAGLGFDVFFGTSANKWGFRDLDHPRRAIGYSPEDRLGDWPLS